jgi:hypothetical protein
VDEEVPGRPHGHHGGAAAEGAAAVRSQGAAGAGGRGAILLSPGQLAEHQFRAVVVVYAGDLAE